MRQMKLEELSDFPWGNFSEQPRIRKLLLTFHFVIQVALSSFFAAFSSFFLWPFLSFPSLSIPWASPGEAALGAGPLPGAEGTRGLVPAQSPGEMLGNGWSCTPPWVCTAPEPGHELGLARPGRGRALLLPGLSPVPQRCPCPGSPARLSLAMSSA